MKKIFFLFSIFFLFLLNAQEKTLEFYGMNVDSEIGRNGLANPERGFRWENRFGSFVPKYQDKIWLAAINNWNKVDGITMTQGYVELIDFAQKDEISAEQIKRLEESFENCRQAGIKVYLCFRYEMNNQHVGPTCDTILKHIEQLKPILRKNMDVIALMQLGFVGLYGEWHRSYHKLDHPSKAAEQAKIISAALDMLPADRKMTMRYPRHKNPFVMKINNREKNQPVTEKEAHTMLEAARIGHHNHAFMVNQSDAGTYDGTPGPMYNYVTEESLFLPVDGELFWVWSSTNRGRKDDGLEAIRRLWEHHYTIFSYAHKNGNYEGYSHLKKYPEIRYSLDEWHEDILPVKFLKENNIPYDKAYFSDKNGKEVNRTIFEFIRDHLGYRLALTAGKYDDTAVIGKPYSAEFRIVNYGFAAPINPRPIYLAVINEKGMQVIAECKKDIRTFYPCLPSNRTQLSPEYTLKFDVASFPELEKGKYQIGIYLPDFYESLQKDSRYSIRLANDNIKYYIGNGNEYGINIFGEIEVK